MDRFIIILLGKFNYENLINPIDEIESIVGSREKSISSNEPQDSIRVVNMLLTQLDRMRLYPNMLLCATSNLSEILDNAFMDRTDLILKVPCPSILAIYSILCDCLREMCKIKLIIPEIYFLDPSAVTVLLSEEHSECQNESSISFSIRLYKIATKANVF